MTPVSSASGEHAGDEAGTSWFYNPRVRGVVFQFLVVAALVGVVAFFAYNAKTNLERAGIASGLGFFSDRLHFFKCTTMCPPAQRRFVKINPYRFHQSPKHKYTDLAKIKTR